MVAVSSTVSFVTVATGGHVGGSWVGYLGGFALIGGLLVSLVAFALAIFAKVKLERWGCRGSHRRCSRPCSLSW